jgi:hypothetical protein
MEIDAFYIPSVYAKNLKREATSRYAGTIIAVGVLCAGLMFGAFMSGKTALGLSFNERSVDPLTVTREQGPSQLAGESSLADNNALSAVSY